MLSVEKRPSRKIYDVRNDGCSIFMQSEYGLMRVSACYGGTIRVSFTRGECFTDEGTPFIIRRSALPAKEISVTGTYAALSSGRLTARIELSDGRVRVNDAAGNTVFSDGGAYELEQFRAEKISGSTDSVKEYTETADGTKTVVRSAEKEAYKTLYRAKLPLKFGRDEAVYGFGQPENGKADLRGRKLYKCQTNKTIAIPFYVSTAGYGLLLDCGCPFIFDDTCDTPYIYLSAVNELTYYIIPGTCDEAVCLYHQLTGIPPLPPAWVFGYIQSQERYETQEEVLKTARMYREKGIGLDCIVLDWCSWPDGQWGQKSFDPVRFPDPAGMINGLHQADTHFMISVWPNTASGTQDNEAFRQNRLLLPDGALYNALLPEARSLYWKQASEGLFRYGTDAWWCDSSEPWTSEWSHAERPLPEAVYYETLATASDSIGADMANAYPFFHAMAIYEGQTAQTAAKRVVNLTRSAWTGQQRFSTILWSGDISAKWTTLRDQIAIGLDMCASGFPYWTQDIGGFFVKKGVQWFWDGDFNEGWDDPEYRELFIRWYQYAAFLPVFRGHGTDIRRELTNLEGAEFEAVLRSNKLRYRLLPYIYSLAWQVSQRGGTIMKPLGFRYPDDSAARGIDDEFLFGNDMLICPVTEYKARCRSVYLPEGLWYSLTDREYMSGGGTYTVSAPLSSIPVFIRAGAIIPTAPESTSAAGAFAGRLTFNVFAGADGEFAVYTDSLDGTGHDEAAVIRYMRWYDSEQKLTVNGTEVSDYTLIR